MIRGIIFDCFGVLYQGSIGHLYELTPKNRHAELANLSLSADYGYVNRADFLEQMGELAGKSRTELEKIMRSDHIRNAALVEHVKTLRSQYTLALLSNVGRGVMDQLFSAEELAELFDVVVLSSDVGMVKPDPEIFKFTSDKMGLLPEDCLMVDDIDTNVEAAQNVGMHGVVFTTTTQFISDMQGLAVLDRE